ncbi:MAG: hypothetical protein RL235_552 [Chlamydiota bacterium]
MTKLKWVFLALASTNVLFATQHKDVSKTRKIYVQPSQVQIENNHIFVQIHHQWVPTRSIHSDATGVYVEEYWGEPWLCGNCGLMTNGWFACQHCGSPK